MSTPSALRSEPLQPTRPERGPRGLIGFPITPVDPDGRVDAAALRRLVRRAADGGVDAVCVLGSTGGYAYLPREERRRAVEAAAEALGGAVPLLAGVGALGTREAVRLAADARAAGAAVGLLAAVSYTPLTEDEVPAHFAAVADGAGLPLCVYDNPGTTHFAVSDALMGRLTALPGVVALKSPAPPREAAAARLAALRACAPAGTSVGFSTDWNAAETVILGADAWHCVLAGLFPAPAAAIRDAAGRGALEEARALDAALEPLWAFMRAHGGLRVMHAAARWAGLGDAPPPAPVQPPPEAARTALFATLDRLRPLLEEGRLVDAPEPAVRG